MSLLVELLVVSDVSNENNRKKSPSTKEMVEELGLDNITSKSFIAYKLMEYYPDRTLASRVVQYSDEVAFETLLTKAYQVKVKNDE